MKNLLTTTFARAAARVLAPFLTAARQEQETDPEWGRYLAVIPTLMDLEKGYPGQEDDIAEIEKNYSDVRDRHRALIAGNERYRALFNRAAARRNNFHDARERCEAAGDARRADPCLANRLGHYRARAAAVAAFSGILLSVRAGGKLYDIYRQSPPAP